MNDRHHILFEKRMWTVRPEARRLRETPSLIPNIPRELHEYIHRNSPIVPVMGYHALRQINGLFVPTRDTLRDIDGLSLSIERAVDNERMHPVERQIGHLAVEAIQTQKHLLIDGGLSSGRQIISIPNAA